MYFKITGKMDVSQMLSSERGEIDNKKFCEQILANDLKIEGYILSSQLEQWKKYYEDMHPRMRLCEDLAQKDISAAEITELFSKYFKPLSADCCSATVVDPYLFSEKTDTSLLCKVVEENVQSKRIRFITDFGKDDAAIKNTVLSKLQTNGFSVTTTDCKDSHDRYWFTRIAGFTIGTSFNGLGKKLSTFAILKQDDLSEIINIFCI